MSHVGSVAPGAGKILLSFFRSYAVYAFLLGLLEARHVAYALGGRLLTLLVMALCGAGVGLFFAWRGIDDLYRNVESGR
jgi:hypothetical protein